MPETTVSIRNIKETLLTLFSKEVPEDALAALCRMPLRKVVNALFPFFYSMNPLHFWQAITAMGAVVSLLADENIESARVVMRRLMWNLNDESGGIGWGSAEAMGEIMARNDQIAGEYACILLSYINPCGNFIDHPALQKGVLWGLGRLAQVRPHLVEGASGFLVPFLTSPNPVLRGLAAWTASALPCNETKPLLIRLCSDNEVIPFFVNGEMCERTVASLAQSRP
jgi:hypothetical protein